MRPSIAVVVTVILAVAAPPAVAGTATSPGVHVDPGSPAGKQYQIPISSARGETAGGSASSKSGSAPTFGSGITPSSSKAATSTTTSAATSPTATTASRATGASARHRRARRRRAQAAAHAKSNAPTPAVTLTNRASRNATTQANQVGSSSWLPLAAGGALVLLIGCGGGLALKRRM